ncbi:MAG: HAMP domain-containing histidine kinase [Rhodospirillales bacterium]|nr:HAMP domain-containing histidine kinase [Rhodospirillales bacterium]
MASPFLRGGLRGPRSLIGRLVLWAAVLFVVSIPVLWSLFSIVAVEVSREAVDTQIREYGSQLRGYWASAAATGALPLSSEAQPDAAATGEPSAPSPFGGQDVAWVWQITAQGQPVLRSEFLRLTKSTLSPRIKEPHPGFLLRTASTVLGPARLAERVVMEGSATGVGGDKKIAVHYMVGVGLDRYDALVDEQTRNLQRLSILVALPTAVFLLGLFFVLILSIRGRLGEVGRAMALFESGDTVRIEGRFPSELQSLVDRMNGMLAHNAKLVERTRKYVTKIAHDLNHPLAVIQNGLNSSDIDTALLRRQVERMTGLIDRYTSLARTIGPEGMTGARTPIAEVLADLRDGYAILYRPIPVEIQVNCSEDLMFSVSRHDLEAMAGNLLSNAHKHARGKISISARLENGLVITVEDDGPGIAEVDRDAAFNWGKRLDEAPPGSGFGLSIVRDVAGLYGGEVSLGRSSLGGLRAELRLPDRPTAETENTD